MVGGVDSEIDETSGMTAEQIAQVEAMKRAVMQKILTKEARERLNRLRLVKPEVAAQLELYLVQLYQSGKLAAQLSDEQLKSVLGMLLSEKRFKIVRHEK
jgi:programmed cell death protein 5